MPTWVVAPGSLIHFKSSVFILIYKNGSLIQLNNSFGFQFGYINVDFNILFVFI